MLRGAAGISRAAAIALASVLSAAGMTVPASAASALPSITVHTADGPVTASQASETPITTSCPAGSVLLGGGIRTYYTGPLPGPDGTNYHPINGLIMRGNTPTDGAASPSADGATDVSAWTAFAGFAGQFEENDRATAFAMCSTADGPQHTVVATKSVNAPTVPSTTAGVTATCPAGTRLVGGGARTTPASSPSQKPVGSYPSDASGAPEPVADPDSWTAVGQSGGQPNLANVTTAFALCSTDPSLHTTVARSQVIDHPAGPGNDTTPGADPVATTTAACPATTRMLSGGALAIGSAAGDDRGSPQQGVHVRGSYPSDDAGLKVADGDTAPAAWTGVVQSGGTPTPGTDTFAFALCAEPAVVGPRSDLRVTNVDTPDPVTAGGLISYALEVTNAGPQAATGTTLEFPLAPGTSYVSSSASAGSCTSAAGPPANVSCELGTLAANSTATVTIVVASSGAGTISTTAAVSSAVPDPVAADNSATAETAVNLPVKTQPALAARASASVPAGGEIRDTATLTGAFDATGTILFDLYGPGDEDCNTPLRSSVAVVSGDGAVESEPVPVETAGAYRWIARYSGDANNEPAGPTACADPDQAVIVTRATPTLATQGSPDAAPGDAIGAVAVLDGGAGAGGTLTFRVHGPDDGACATPLATTTQPVEGAGAYPSAPYTPDGPGTYRWTAAYSGDDDNAAIPAGPCAGTAQSTVAGAPPALPAVAVYAVRRTLSIGNGEGDAVSARCPAGTRLTGGGTLLARSTGAAPSGNLKVNGTLPSDGSGAPATGGPADPDEWTSVAAFGGGSEPGHEARAFALCAAAPAARHTSVVVATSADGAAAIAPAGVTATCPDGTRLVGGGALGTPPSAPSFRPVASFPSDDAGRAALPGATDPGSWTAIGAAPAGTAGVTTSAFALCSDAPELHTSVARVDAQGPQTANAAVAVTVTCPPDTRLLSGGVRVDASGVAPAQGVHLSGSYPSAADGSPVPAGTQAPASWTTVVQAGNGSAAGTNQRAFALCAAIPGAPPPAPGPVGLPAIPPSIGVSPAPAPAARPSPSVSVKLPNAAEIAASLRRQIVPTGRGARISVLLRPSGGIPLRVTALRPGRVVVSWYRNAPPRGGRQARHLLLARGGLTFTRARTATITIRPTPLGRRLLRRSKRAALTSVATWTPTSGRRVVAKRAFVLRR